MYDEATGCWLWRFGQSDGYGSVRHKGRTYRAHRFVYERVVGPIPDGLVLDHLCENKLCVNPGHMEPVTHATNIRRAVAKLTEDDVRFIRRSRESNKALARRFGVTASYLSKLRAWPQLWPGVT